MVLSLAATSGWGRSHRPVADRPCRSSETTAHRRRRAAIMSVRRCTAPITVTGRITAMATAGATDPGVGVGDGAGSARYFRTQITRTTDALASVEVPAA